MARKLYTAFVSSVYSTLKGQRETAISCLMDNFIFPVCPERFTATSNGTFEETARLIDICDFVVLLLGRDYGDCDSDGVSMTQKEYEYARDTGKPIIAYVCDDFYKGLLDNASGPVPRQPERQREFVSSIPATVKSGVGTGIAEAITRYWSTADRSGLAGWERNENAVDRGFETSHRAFDLRGRWYHVHLSEDDLDYIRIGTADITQDFTPRGYLDFSVSAVNYSAVIGGGEVREKRTEGSRWSGSYHMDKDGLAEGIYRAKRGFTREYNGERLDKGVYRRGIHTFKVDVAPYDGRTEMFEGSFNDEAPSPKIGMVYFFRSVEDRDAFVLENRGNIGD